MNSSLGLERFLRTDPLDGGCAEAMNTLHVYVERWLAGDNVRSLMPRVATHLVGCDPCSDDFDGLLAAAS